MTNTSSGAEAGGAGELAALLEAVRQADRHLAQAVLLAGRLASSGVAERVEGLPLDLLLGLAGRMTGADRRCLVAAGEVLTDLPVTAGLFGSGALGWGQVRAIVAAAKRLPAADRAALDGRVAATVEARGGVDAFDPDALVWAVDAAAEELRGAHRAERAEQRRRDTSFLSVQPSFDGGLRMYGEFDAVTGAPVLNALDDAAGPPDPAEPPSTAADSQPDTGPRWSATSRSQQYAAALASVAADWLGGTAGRPARPLLIAHVDLRDATATHAGTVELNVRGPLPRLTARMVEQLAVDADLRSVIFDGARPLAVSAKLTAAAIPARTRIAVTARDRGCRFPGSRDPAGHADLHHIVHRADGGDHHPDRLVSLSRRHHTLTHRHRWQLTLNPNTGEVTAARQHRRWRSLPRGTPLTATDPDPDHPAGPFWFSSSPPGYRSSTPRAGRR